MIRIQTMSISELPQEILFSILKYLQPGAIWLFCRRVSRAWKLHVDVNIERYYKYYASALESERERLSRISPTSVSQRGHLDLGLQANTLYVLIELDSLEGLTHSYSLVVKFESIDMPIDIGTRDLTQDVWEEEVRFVDMDKLQIEGVSFVFRRIDHFIFPGFATPIGDPDQPISTSPLEFGSHTIMFGQYKIGYSITSGDNDYLILSIHYITVPLRSLMRFSKPHYVTTEMTVTSSGGRRRYLSSLFNTSTDELEYSPEVAILQSLPRRWDDQNYRYFTIENVCEICKFQPADEDCRMERCTGCCFRNGICRAHLSSWRGEQAKLRRAIEAIEHHIAMAVDSGEEQHDRPLDSILDRYDLPVANDNSFGGFIQVLGYAFDGWRARMHEWYPETSWHMFFAQHKRRKSWHGFNEDQEYQTTRSRRHSCHL